MKLWYFELNKPNFDFSDRWLNLTTLSTITINDYQIDKIKKKTIECKLGLLSNSNYRFTTQDFNSISFGDIEISTEDSINENRLEAIIPLKIDNFHK